MSAFACPRCHGPLVHTRSGELRWWECRQGHGRTFNLTVLRKRAGKEHFRKFWGILRHRSPAGSLGCPSCRQAMEVSQHPTGTGTVELDHCRACQLLWFDDGEVTALAGPEPEPPPDPLGHLDPVAREDVLHAQARLTMESTRFEREHSELPPDTSGVAMLGAMLGFPVEDNAPARRVLPLLSWGLGVAMLAGGAWALAHLDHTWETAGFYGEAPLKDGGLSALKSLVLDPRPLSVLLNVGVVFRLADNVEDVLGRVGFTILLTASTLAAWGVHAAFLSTPGRPMMGLTAAAAAIAVFYALRFPRVRLGWYAFQRGGGFFDREGFSWRMVEVRWAVPGWLAVAMFYPWMMAESEPPNSWLEAVVGAGVGAAAFWGFGRGLLRHPDEQPVR